MVNISTTNRNMGYIFYVQQFYKMLKSFILVIMDSKKIVHIKMKRFFFAAYVFLGRGYSCLCVMYFVSIKLSIFARQPTKQWHMAGICVA